MRSSGLGILRETGVYEPLFDTLVVRPGHVETMLFTDHRKFPNGTPKVAGVDTNLTQSGHLGYPFSYYLQHWSVLLEKWSRPEDARAVFAALRLQLGFGDWKNEPWRNMSAAQFGPSLLVTDGVRMLNVHHFEIPTRSILEDIDDFVALRKAVSGGLREHIAAGVWPLWSHSLDRKSRRIGPTEAFWVRAICQSKDISDEVRLKVLLRGAKTWPEPAPPAEEQDGQKK